MPRRYESVWNRDTEEYEDYEPQFSDTRQEPEDVRVAPGVPTLYEIRKHITEHKWNGDECEPDMTNEQVFVGQCEYASTAMSEMLSDNPKGTDWSRRVRGWYCGDLSYIKMSSPHGVDEHVWTDAKHCHSWVVHNGKIYDATYWQFGGDEVRVYEFELNDPRFVPDDKA